VEGIDWKGVVKRSWSKERQESAKERERIVPKREKWERRRGKVGMGGVGEDIHGIR
jgi:hypothetical protein